MSVSTWIALSLALVTSAPQEGPRPGGRPGRNSDQQGGPTEPAQPAGQPAENDWAKSIKDYELKAGPVNAYLKGESLLFEVPAKMLGRDFLTYVELKATPNGSYSGTEVGTNVTRFEVRGDKVLLRSIDFSTVANEGAAMQFGLAQSNVQPIIATFDVKAKSPEGGYLIDVSRIFRNGLPELPIAGALGGGSLDSSRTFIDKVSAYPQNINVEVTATATGGGGAGAGGGRRSAFGGPASRPSNTGTFHFSMVLLPEKPMMARLKDSRVGYFDTGFTDFSSKEQGSREYSFIDRYRLEKKDPNAAVSEPLKPIVYYVAKEVPERWRKYVKQGIEDWKPAFEAAGFKNAIIAADPPSDPNWSPEDVRYSTIRWAPLAIQNAMGPHVADPRSGEILSAHVIIWHDVLKLGNDWYFSQAGACDPRAQKLPFSDELAGEILRFVVAHEVGHTLGLPHNGKSSGMIPVEWLRSPQWTKANGTCTSIMDYARFNYVAQPGDGAALIPKVGTYDKASISWGYTPIANAHTPWEEKKTLDAWAAKMVAEPTLRFYDNFSSTDPTAMAEALGDDAALASTYGVANLKRIMAFLPQAAVKTGEEYSDLARYHAALTDEFGLFIGHVNAMVGGFVQTNFLGGRGGNVYNPVPKARQAAAVKWQIDNVIKPPVWLYPTNILAKLGPSSARSAILGMQRRSINGLLNDSRLGRLVDTEVMYGAANAYTVSALFHDLRDAVWASTGGRKIVVNPYDRAMQRLWVTSLTGKMTSASSDVRGHVGSELRWTKNFLDTTAKRTSDGPTRAHFEDLAAHIEQTLKFPPQPAPAPATNTPTFPFGPITDEEPEHFGCGLCPATIRRDK